MVWSGPDGMTAAVLAGEHPVHCMRGIAAFVLAIAALGTVAASLVMAYTVPGATFTPSHGAPGARVEVIGLPLAADCPDIRVWLSRDVSPSPPITSPRDPRLIRLHGTVSHPPIGDGGLGDRRPGTMFTFAVPSLPPGKYGTYDQCRPASSAFPFGAGSTRFVIDHAPPSTDTIVVGPAGDRAPPAGDAVARAALALGAGGLAFLGLLLPMATRRRRR
jgi:hypothetical protein